MKLILSKPVFLLVFSLAFLAASLACDAKAHLDTITLAESGFSIKNLSNPSPNTSEAIFLTSELPSFVFVCPSNCGSGCLQDITIVKPSLTSSPVNASSFSFNIPEDLAYLLTILVNACLTPSSCIPPSCVRILLVNE